MRPHVFSIAPGCPFLETFVASLNDGQVIPEFSQRSQTLELPQIKIFVPTRRAARALAQEFVRQSGRTAPLLPSILPLGDVEDDGSELVSDAVPDVGLPRAASDLERRMILGELVLEWSARLKHAIVSIDQHGVIQHAPEALLVGARPVDAWRLSGELARLIDDMTIENVAWRNLGDLNGDYDEYWRLTLDFLNICIDAWPKIQRERGFVDPALRQKDAISRAVEAVKAHDQPVIALGSTGSNVNTATLLAAIAHSKRGAIVLPGLDYHLDEASYATLQDSRIANPTHPQAFLARLLKRIGIDRRDVRPLGTPTGHLAARQDFISESFRPAETTHQWRNWRLLQGSGDVQSAFQGIALIEAANEREEALAIAVCLRESLEDETRTTALVTPDRALAKRVRAELLRWDVEIDDSAGIPLGLTRAGTLARLVLAALSGRAQNWASLLFHPLANFGLGQEAKGLSRLFEIGVLRAGSKTAGCWRDHVDLARALARRRDAHPSQMAISEAQWRELESYALRIDQAVAPLLALSAGNKLCDWLAAHRAALDMIVGDDEAAWMASEDGESLDALFVELTATASARYTLDLETYISFLDAVLSERVLRGGEGGHPRLKILGLLEARLFPASRFILSGLDEAVWPPEAATDSLLNRPMRDALGLSSVDRRIGQTAHDFCQALGAQEVILTRAKKREGAPTTPSRFLQRMEALGSDVFDDLRRRGKYWLELARCLDLGEPAVVLNRPEPKPPVGLRPKTLSVTKIETLRRDPYSIYARHILKLERLPQFEETVGAREIGIAAHTVLEQFCRNHPSGPLPHDARSILLELLQRNLNAVGDDPEFKIFRWPRLEKGIDVYLGFEVDRRPKLKTLFVEESGALPISLIDGSVFLLTCRADRIELMTTGEIAVADYKTGEIPTLAQIEAGFAPQLTLEAAMVERGAFPKIPRHPVVGAYYIPLGGSKTAVMEIKASSRARGGISDLVNEHFSELVDLLNRFQDPLQGYPARPFPQFAARFNDYDHLARTREWSVGVGDTTSDT